MGRPKLNIDPKMVEALASVGCTASEIARVLKCSPPTISKRFAAEFANGQNQLRTGLRKKQVDMAMSGDRTMLIWLGKQYLDQSEKQEIKQQTALRTYGAEDVARIRKALQVLKAENTAAASTNNSSNGNALTINVASRPE